MTRQHRRLRDFRGALRPVGAVMIGVGVAIAASGAVGFAWDLVAPSARIPVGGLWPCLFAALASVVLGAACMAASRGHVRETMSRREALVSVAAIWLGAGLCGALPFVFGARMSLADGLFESISGLTTTGATVITDIETRLSRPLLLWRSMSQWLGGMGIVVLFVAVFPSVGAGAKHLYRGEAPGAQAEGFRPRIAETSLALWRLYALFTLVEIALLWVAGMDLFEALCHGLTTLSTGGFSTRDASVAGFAMPAVEWIIATFMLLGSINYGLYYFALRGRGLRSIGRDPEFRTFVGLVLLSTSLLTLLNIELHPGGYGLDSLRFAYFQVATTVSSTGYGTDDTSTFGAAAFTLVLALMFVGGMSGSTAGGIKVERIVLMAKQTFAQVRRSFDPSVVQVVRMGRSVVAKPILADVMSFFVIYIACLGVGVLFVCTVDGVPIPTAFGAMLTCLSNMGPAPFHELAGFADNFAPYSPVSKTFFVVAMLLGRLEFFTLFALLVPGFWRR